MCDEDKKLILPHGECSSDVAVDGLLNDGKDIVNRSRSESRQSLREEKSVLDSTWESQGNVAMASNYIIEPPGFISDTKSYATYKDDLERWARITGIPAENQADVVVHGLENHPSGIKEKIIINIGDELKNNKDGIKSLLTFLDTIYKVDEMADAWNRYKNFQKVSRSDNTPINEFIAEFDKEYLRAKTAGCVYSDTLLAFRLLEATNLSEMDEKFVLTGIDYVEAKTQANLCTQFKASLKKFQGRKTLSGDDKLKFDPALVSSVAQVLLSEGWKKPQYNKQRRRSNSEPSEPNLPKERKNPKTKDGKQKTCFKCGSEYHLLDRCPKKNSDTQNKQHALNANATEFGMITNDNSNKSSQRNNHEYVMFVSDSVECETVTSSDDVIEGKSYAELDTYSGEISSDNGLQHSELDSIEDSEYEINESFHSSGSDIEYVMIAKTENELCLMVEEAGINGVIDSACSKTVAGKNYVTKYIDSLPEKTRDGVDINGEPSTTIYQFGGGERRKSERKIALPALIGNILIRIETEVVNADIPLLIGANSLEKSKAVLDFGTMKATFFQTSKVDLMEVLSGHFCISLISKLMDTSCS